jgi:hypothetical protein
VRPFFWSQRKPGDPAGGRGDLTAAPSGFMPEGGYFFDAIVRQPPIDDDKLDPADNLEEFALLNDADLAFYRAKKAWFEAHADLGTLLVIPGAAFGDIALVPAPFLKNPRGIRDIEEWYISTAGSTISSTAPPPGRPSSTPAAMCIH